MNEFANIDKYGFTIRPLSSEDGGGFLIEYPDLPGCHSDGDTPEQAIVNGRDAVRSYLLSCRKHGDPIPKPSSPAMSSGQFRLRMPKSLHARLAAQAESEGVSLNMLVVSAAAQALGRRETTAPRAKAQTYVGCTNSDAFYGGTAGQWLCSRIEGTSNDEGLSWIVDYEFIFAAATFLVIAPWTVRTWVVFDRFCIGK